MNPLIIYLLAANIITFALFGIDKLRAIKRRWRIRESVLLLCSLLGGSVGGLLSMYTFRHKTQTPIFKFGMPIILLLQVGLALAIKYR